MKCSVGASPQLRAQGRPADSCREMETRRLNTKMQNKSPRESAVAWRGHPPGDSRIVDMPAGLSKSPLRPTVTRTPAQVPDPDEYGCWLKSIIINA